MPGSISRKVTNYSRRMAVLFHSRTMTVGMLMLGCLLDVNIMLSGEMAVPDYFVYTLFGVMLILMIGMAAWYAVVCRRRIPVTMPGRCERWIEEGLSTAALVWFFAYSWGLIPTQWLGGWWYCVFASVFAGAAFHILLSDGRKIED